LLPLEIAQRPWALISMDFVEELPRSDGFNSILVVVDRLTKWSIFIPTTTKLSTLGLVDLIIDNVVCQHGLPTSIISDRGSKFTSRLWRGMCKSLGTKVSLSTAFHPQSDGQTERVNQVLEQYLRTFVNYRQDDWSGMLPRAAFSYNNSFHSATNMSPFLANYGYHPRWAEEILIDNETIAPVVEKANDLVELHEMCKFNIQLANEAYAKAYDDKHIEQPDFEVNDLVMLSLQNITTKRPMKKLDYKFVGPFKILERIGLRAFRLQLPNSIKVHNVFHVSLLRRFNANEIPGQTSQPPMAIEVNETTDTYEVESIVDGKNIGRSFKYLVQWKGYDGLPDSTTWEPISHLEGCEDLVNDYHQSYPDRPKPLSRQ
jgi:hypothetical protein